MLLLLFVAFFLFDSSFYSAFPFFPKKSNKQVNLFFKIYSIINNIIMKLHTITTNYNLQLISLL